MIMFREIRVGACELLVMFCFFIKKDLFWEIFVFFENLFMHIKAMLESMYRRGSL